MAISQNSPGMARTILKRVIIKDGLLCAPFSDTWTRRMKADFDLGFFAHDRGAHCLPGMSESWRLGWDTAFDQRHAMTETYKRAIRAVEK